MAALKATGERYRNHRGVLYEWSTVAGAAGDHGLALWLGGRSIADDAQPIDARRCELSLAGLGFASRELHAISGNVVFTTAQAACGQLGLQLTQMNERTRKSFLKDVADGRRNGIAELSSEKAIDAIRKGVIEGANEAEQDNDPIFFEKLLGEPDGYRYTALLRTVGSAKERPALQRTKDKPGRRK
jgi:hypothetical protein